MWKREIHFCTLAPEKLVVGLSNFSPNEKFNSDKLFKSLSFDIQVFYKDCDMEMRNSVLYSCTCGAF